MHQAMVLSIPIPSCPGGSADPLCGLAGSAGSTLLGAGASSVLQSVTSWVVDGASWLLGQIGSALSSTTTVDIGAGWFTSHYQVMVGLAAVVVLPMLLCALVQSVYRQSPSMLVRSVLVQLPLALLLAAAMVQLVGLALAVTDDLSSAVASGSGTDIQQALSGLAGVLVTQTADGQQVPAFVALLGGLLVAFGAFLLWVELLVRAAAVYVAVLFLPLALASLVWPAVSHWCRRLVDTLVALILAKFVIVAVLSLAVGALGSGTSAGFGGVLAGGALLLLAAFTPFTLLRLIPAVEAGAALQLEGSRHRVQQAMNGAPRTAAAFALRAVGSGPSTLATGEPGTGMAVAFDAPGADGGGPAPPGSVGPGSLAAGGAGRRSTGATGRRAAEAADPGADGADGAGGVPDWRGNPASNRAFEQALGRSPGPSPTAPLPVHFGIARPPGDPTGHDPTHSAGPSDGATDDQSPDRAVAVPGRRGVHRIGHDELGPVITWVPAGASGGRDGGDGRDG